MVQFFKENDALEQKMYESGAAAMSAAGMTLDDFDADAYESQPFGDIISDNNLSPLSNAITKEIFRQFFNEVFLAFGSAGTFESYISVFKKIFGDDVDIVFTVPDPGSLEIDITTMNIEVFNFVARRIVDDQYVFDNVVTEDDEQILFRSIKGFESQYELEQMLFELVPGGIATTITLAFG